MNIKKFISPAISALVALSLSLTVFASNYKPVTSIVEESALSYASATIELAEDDFPELYVIDNWEKGIAIQYIVTVDGEESLQFDVSAYAEFNEDDDWDLLDDYKSEVVTGDTIKSSFISDFEITSVSGIEFEIVFDDAADLDGKEVTLTIDSITIGGDKVDRDFDPLKVEIIVENFAFAATADFTFNKEDHPELYDPANWANGMTIEFALTADGERIVLDESALLYAFFKNDIIDWEKAINSLSDLNVMDDAFSIDELVYSAELEELLDYEALEEVMGEFESLEDIEDLTDLEDFMSFFFTIFEKMGLSFSAADFNDDGINSVELKTKEELETIIEVGMYVTSGALEDYAGQEVSLEVIDISVTEEEKIDEPITEEPVKEKPAKKVEKVKNPTTGAGGIVAVVGMSAIALTAVTVSRKRK